MATQKPQHLSRNIGIVVAVIVILAVTLVAGYYMGIGTNATSPTPTASPTPVPTATPIPFDFTITNGGSLTIIQGTHTVDTVTVALVGIPMGFVPSVNLSVDSGSSGIQCSLDTTSGSPTLYSNIEINVPDSTPTGAYSIIITATGDGVTHSTAITISVLTSQVTVSGTVKTTGLGTSPTQIQFVDTQSDLTYTASLSGTSYFVNLQNEHTYTVTVTWKGALGNTGTYNGGSLYVYAPVGYTSQSQDYSG